MNKEERRNWFAWVPGQMRPMSAEVEPFVRREDHITNDLSVRAPSRIFHRPARDNPLQARIHGSDIIDELLLEKGQQTKNNTTQ